MKAMTWDDPRIAAGVQWGRLGPLVLTALLAIGMTPWGTPDAAAASALLLSSEPAEGQQMAAPRWLVLHFNTQGAQPRCTVSIVYPDSRTILLLHRGADSPPDTVRYLLPALPQGSYRILWKAVTADGQNAEGSLSFSVR